MNYEPYTDDYLCATYEENLDTGERVFTGYITQAEALKKYHEPLNNNLWINCEVEGVQYEYKEQG